MTSKFKGLDLIDRVPEELWIEVHNRRQFSESSPRKRNEKKTKWLSKEAFQITLKKEKRKAKEERKDLSI